MVVCATELRPKDEIINEINNGWAPLMECEITMRKAAEIAIDADSVASVADTTSATATASGKMEDVEIREPCK